MKVTIVRPAFLSWTGYGTSEECHDFPARTKARCIALLPSVCFDLFLTDAIHSFLSQLICNGQPVLDVNVIFTSDDNDCIVKLLHLHCANGPCNSESGNNLHNVILSHCSKILTCMNHSFQAHFKLKLRDTEIYILGSDCIFCFLWCHIVH